MQSSFFAKYQFSLIVFIAAVVYIITAYNSHGYYQADEHYQIIEFSGLKLGTHSPDELAWEYNTQIRPSLQPAISFLLLKSFDLLNISDPYSKVFLLRLLTALLAIAVISYFILKTRHLIVSKTDRLVYYLLSFFFWFIPVISVRFSSETWSGLMFLLALASFYDNSGDKFKPYKIGLLLGVAFLFRFQIAFAILGFGLCLLFIHHSKYVLKIFASFMIILFFGVLADSWFYGEFVFTPWNYYYQNIVEGVASSHGTSPWYFYIKKLIAYPTYFIGIPIIISFIILLISKPKNLLLWCVLPFIIGHSFIAHKEERFLFPLVYLFPLILVEAYLIFKKLITKRIILKSLNYLLLTVFIFVNSIGLYAMVQKSAGIGRMEITKYIHDNYGDGQVNLVYCAWANPYNPWHGLPSKFYLEDNLTDQRIDDLCELNDSLIIENAVNLLVIRKLDKDNILCSEKIKEYDYTFEIQSVPEWIEKLNNKFKWFENKEILELYRY